MKQIAIDLDRKNGTAVATIDGKTRHCTIETFVCSIPCYNPQDVVADVEFDDTDGTSVRFAIPYDLPSFAERYSYDPTRDFGPKPKDLVILRENGQLTVIGLLDGDRFLQAIEDY